MPASVIPPPPGVTVDFDHPRQQKVLEHYLIFGIGGTIAFIALCQRFYTKIFLSKGLQIDDAFMFLGWVASVVTQAMLVANSRKDVYVTAPVYMLCNGFTKLSLLTFYLHLSPQRWFRICVWIGIVVVSLYSGCITLLMLFHCNPVRKAFDFTINDGKCLDVAVLYIATAVSNIATDVMLFILPMPMIFNLRMKIAQKIGAMLIFGIGSITIATSIIRLVLLPKLLTSTDPSWDAAPANIWTFIEGNLFVICGSMPTLRKFFKHFAPKLMGTSTNPSSYGAVYHASYANQQSHNTKSRARSQYQQFSDQNEMHTFHSDHKRGMDDDSAFTSVVVAGGGRESADDMSDKAILQTKTVTIQRD
ncbi:Satratoxin biosynthesis SC1 cluster protein 4 [Colletotrichum sp. SAR 10_86]|nr:Satratoxin biosynthesis SC1 cluster protein 4 [Colletotrichum sp. SAR 10_65]KAI8205623.1 Satratoxin biosynthesis SC1 cluster protein 4 [Colletotrichum sp. SAR 10_76]KAI8230110.1 Satratoxin biosynthesis SC1 cluster protein 4 [Colletotrichum sp. SAR 10_86]KAJ5008169.1 Satratoxin biosynthesis SC1 cluster protein 4 [Colletotrichum sp. SAR 10_66]